MDDDLPDDWWTTQDVAKFLGVAASTVRAYMVREQMPPPDRRIGRTMVWKPPTIRDWHAARPRRSTKQ